MNFILFLIRIFSDNLIIILFYFTIAVPSPVEDCVVSNETVSSAIIQCQAGFDGGLPQKFHIELYSSRALVATAIEEVSPDFVITNLPSGVSLIALVFAVNGRGRSNAVAFNVITKSKPWSEGRSVCQIYIQMFSLKRFLYLC